MISHLRDMINNGKSHYFKVLSHIYLRKREKRNKIKFEFLRIFKTFPECHTDSHNRETRSDNVTFYDSFNDEYEKQTQT